MNFTRSVICGGVSLSLNAGMPSLALCYLFDEVVIGVMQRMTFLADLGP